jgi:hypothetical protein
MVKKGGIRDRGRKRGMLVISEVAKGRSRGESLILKQLVCSVSVFERVVNSVSNDMRYSY